MTAYTQKFPNGTFEEVSSVVNDITELAEECCRNDTDPTCFSKRESAISQRPCEKVSLLHWHPDMKQCCSLHVNERTRCLLRLQYSEEQLPSLLELSNEEICAEYKQDPNSFTLRYVYEFARRHRSVPAGFMLNVTLDHARMAKNCCSPKVSTPCFLQETMEIMHNLLAVETKLVVESNEREDLCGQSGHHMPPSMLDTADVKALLCGGCGGHCSVEGAEVTALWRVRRSLLCGGCGGHCSVEGVEVMALWKVWRSWLCGECGGHCSVESAEVTALWRVRRSLLCGRCGGHGSVEGVEVTALWKVWRSRLCGRCGGHCSVESAEVTALWKVWRSRLCGRCGGHGSVEGVEVTALWKVWRSLLCGECGGHCSVEGVKVTALWRVWRSLLCGGCGGHCSVEGVKVTALWGVWRSLLCGGCGGHCSVEGVEVTALWRVWRPLLCGGCEGHCSVEGVEVTALLTAYYGSLLQVQFEEASVISHHFQSGLAKCCFQGRPKCIIEEFTSFLKVLCKESILSSMPNEFKMCCGKGLLDSLTCMDNLKRQPLASGNTTEITGTQLCENHQPDSLDRYLFQIGVKHTSVSLPVLTTIQNHLRNTVEACCSEANDTKACLEEKENSLEKKAALLTKADGFCSQYFKLDLPAFKTMVEREVQGEGAEARAQAWVELVTSCCFQHSPAQLCQNLTEAIVKSEDGSTA
ncbi:vitamin D-binding protein [Brachyhypopomus gauderio]|uniref:vitamin D-binding protein n=1 Tax=Brachyhypopomus gauderio TaxID=698409 RepID=UPI004042608F